MNNNVRAGAAAVALLLAPLAATAADLGGLYKAPSPAYVTPIYANWTGFYVGVNGGYGFGKSHWDDPAVDPEPKGFLVGGTLGYNLQTGAFVWGVEGDVDYSAVKGSSACGFGDCETRNDWLGTARLRIGYAGFSNLLPYVTGGAAFGSIKATNSAFGGASATNVGWTAGGGLEYAMAANWSVKAEYLYVDLGSITCGTACGGIATDASVSFKEQLIRAGLNYRF